MEVPEHVQNGVVVLDGGVSLPEGAAVVVVLPAAIEPTKTKPRVKFPLVNSGQPGFRAYPRTVAGEGDSHILLGSTELTEVTGHRKMSQSPTVLMRFSQKKTSRR